MCQSLVRWITATLLGTFDRNNRGEEIFLPWADFEGVPPGEGRAGVLFVHFPPDGWTVQTYDIGKKPRLKGNGKMHKSFSKCQWVLSGATNLLWMSECCGRKLVWRQFGDFACPPLLAVLGMC
jgi:hypothetical protein